MNIDEIIENIFDSVKKHIDNLYARQMNVPLDVLSKYDDAPLSECDVLRFDYLLSIFLTAKNIEYFNEHEPILRKLSGVTVKSLGQEIGISGQALTQFEKNKDFPISRIKPLLVFYVSKSIDLIYEKNYTLFNYIFTLFFFDSQKYSIDFASKKEFFNEFKLQINNDEIRQNFILELESFKKYKTPFSLDFMSLFFSGKQYTIKEIVSDIIIEGNDIIEKLNRNLKNLRYLMDLEQEPVAQILGVTTKTYNYYENYNYKLGKNALDYKQICLLLNAVFDHISKATEHKINYLRIMRFLWPQEKPENEKILQEAVTDFCIAIKYKQSKTIFNFFDHYFTYLEINSEFHLPLDNFWDNHKTQKLDNRSDNIFH